MCRVAALLAAVLFALVGLAPSEAASAQTAPRAALLACDHAVRARSRAAVFVGEMRGERPGDRLEMRFDLLAGSARRLLAVDVPGLGVWRRARPGVRRYVRHLRLQRLPAPGAYRALISFRWLKSPTGAVRRVVQRRTPICLLPGPGVVRRPAVRGALTARLGGR